MTLLALRSNSLLDTMRHESVQVGTTSVLIVPANQNRRLLLIQNDSNKVVYLCHGGPAELHKGIRLEANGGQIECSHNTASICSHAVYAIRDGMGTSTLLITEGS